MPTPAPLDVAAERWRELRMPGRLERPDAEHVARLTAILLHPRTRPMLRQLIAEMVDEALAELRVGA